MLKRVNDRLNRVAIVITQMVSTMWCAIIFAIIAFITLPKAIHGGTSTLIPWIAQTFLQLVLLSIIMVGQELQSQKTEKRAEEDHERITIMFDEVKDMHRETHELVKELHELRK